MAKASVKAQSNDYQQSAINLTNRDWRLIRLVAVARQSKAGKGRPSASAVIGSLIERCRRDLEQEARDALK